MDRYFGVMLDCSRNAVMKVSTVKTYVDYLVKMGYNCLLLYTEDTYEIEGEPYFGYLRGRYTADELKEIDGYCQKVGVELIPCVQTLAHLNSIFRWEAFFGVQDINDILLVDEEKTYALIRKMFETISKCFTSRHVNIGMDEAHMLGLGRHLDLHGFENRFDILRRHLDKVVEIAKEFGFTPFMWSDMFFRLVNNGGYYTTDPSIVTDEMKKCVPEGVELAYWDYYHMEEKDYLAMIEAHKRLSNDRIWFAGGAWSWYGPAPYNGYSLRTMLPAMRACKAQGVQDIFLTLWGDNGKECSFFGLLPSLYYLKCVYDGIEDEEVIKKGFKEVIGEDFDKMMALDLPNKLIGNIDNYNPAKYILYTDPFLSYADGGIPAKSDEVYAEYARTLAGYATSGKFAYIFRNLSDLCAVLSLKSKLGLGLRAAYQAKNAKTLKGFVKDMTALEKAIVKFHESFRVLWFAENKPHGFDVQDLRLGGLLARVKACKRRLKDYLAGKVETIPELEETVLLFYGGRELFILNKWSEIASVNIL